MINVICILEESYLYSREYCETHDLMVNDNADSDVIAHTQDKYKTYVRFYSSQVTVSLYK
jgi:hypothetical protein